MHFTQTIEPFCLSHCILYCFSFVLSPSPSSSGGSWSIDRLLLCFCFFPLVRPPLFLFRVFLSNTLTPFKHLEPSPFKNLTLKEVLTKVLLRGTDCVSNDQRSEFYMINSLCLNKENNEILQQQEGH